MIDTTVYQVQIRANARLCDARRKTVDACPVEQRTEICVVLIADYNWTLEVGEKQVPERYREAVEKELGIVS